MSGQSDRPDPRVRVEESQIASGTLTQAAAGRVRETIADEAAAQPLPRPKSAAGGKGLERCETCGNEYDKTFRVVMQGEVHVFDCFECAIQKLAPACSHCGCRILGHGVETAGVYFCCAHCAQSAGVQGAADRV